MLTAIFLVGGTLLWWSNWPAPSPRNAKVASDDQPTTRTDSASPQPATEPVSKANTSDNGAGQHRKFQYMPARERNEILDEIAKLDIYQIFQHYIDANKIEKDIGKQSGIANILTVALTEKEPSPEFIEKMHQFVIDRSYTDLERGLIVGAFAGTQTKVGAEFVLWSATIQPDQDIRSSNISFIEQLGGGGSQKYLPAMIEPLWRESKDPKMLKSVARAMAREGAPSSIELLLQAASAPDDQHDDRWDYAGWALTKISSPYAVPPLADALKKSPFGSTKHTLAFITLTQIGDETAAQALVASLQTADESAAPMILSWLTDSQSSEIIDAAEAALAAKVPFNSEKIREALSAGTAAYRAKWKAISRDK